MRIISFLFIFKSFSYRESIFILHQKKSTNNMRQQQIVRKKKGKKIRKKAINILPRKKRKTD